MYEKLIQNIELLSQKKGINKTTALIESGAGKNFGSTPKIVERL